MSGWGDGPTVPDAIDYYQTLEMCELAKMLALTVIPYRCALMLRTRCFPGLLADAARQCEGERAPALQGVSGSAPSCEAYER